jgi:hypothetical protein
LYRDNWSWNGNLLSLLSLFLMLLPLLLVLMFRTVTGNMSGVNFSGTISTPQMSKYEEQGLVYKVTMRGAVNHADFRGMVYTKWIDDMSCVICGRDRDDLAVDWNAEYEQLVCVPCSAWADRMGLPQ